MYLAESVQMYTFSYNQHNSLTRWAFHFTGHSAGGAPSWSAAHEAHFSRPFTPRPPLSSAWPQSWAPAGLGRSREQQVLLGCELRVFSPQTTPSGSLRGWNSCRPGRRAGHPSPTLRNMRRLGPGLLREQTWPLAPPPRSQPSPQPPVPPPVPCPPSHLHTQKSPGKVSKVPRGQQPIPVGQILFFYSAPAASTC